MQRLLKSLERTLNFPIIEKGGLGGFDNVKSSDSDRSAIPDLRARFVLDR